MFPAVGPALLVAAALLLMLALRARRRERALRDRGIAAAATVIDSENSHGYVVIGGVVMPVPTHEPNIQFCDESGRARRKRIAAPGEDYGVGDMVRVIYDRASPDHAEVLTSDGDKVQWARRSAPLFAVATVPLVVGIVIIWA